MQVYVSVPLKDLERFFGKDSRRVVKALYTLKNNWDYPVGYRACPSILEYKKLYGMSQNMLLLYNGYRDFKKRWYAEHPKETKREAEILRKWENIRNKQFRTIFGAAKRNGLYMKFSRGDESSCGDRWLIYKHQKLVAIIDV